MPSNGHPDPLASSSGGLRPYLWGLAAVGLAILIRLMLGPMLGERLPYITLFPAVFFAAWYGGLGPALVATAVGVAAASVYFFPPAMGLASPDGLIEVFGHVLFAGVGVAAGYMGRGRLQANDRASRALRLAADAVTRAEEAAVQAEIEAATAEEERLRAEQEALRAEEEGARAEDESARATREARRVEQILSSITDAFMVLDPDWNLTYINQRVTELTGRTAAQCIGRKYWEAFPETAGGPFEQAYRQASTTRHMVRMEAYSELARRWLQVSVYPSEAGLTVVGQDVTDRILAQEATSRLAAIVASSEDGIIGKQLDGTVTSWNAGAERMFGYSAAEMIGTSIFRLIPEELHGAEQTMLRRLARGERVEVSEVERIRKDGERILTSISISPICDATGAVIGAASIKRDITERRRMEAELVAASAQTQELARALDQAQAMVLQLDGRIMYWSTGSSRLYGWSSEEAVGRRSHELLQTQLPMPIEDIRSSLLAHGQWEGDATHLAKDGRRVVVASQWILRRGEGGEPLAIIQVDTDVTPQRHAEERIRQTERMEVVGQLAGGVAHEANNQMTVVLGAADFVLRRADIPEMVRKDVEQIRAAAERTAAITAQLLAFSRRQVLQTRVLDLDETVQGLEPALRRALGERSTLALRLSGGEARAEADPGQLSQVLLNLVLNARDAMPLGGHLTVETGVVELTKGYAQQHPGVAIQPGPFALLTVTDTGHGMSHETMGHIFEPFFTTKPIGQGTGLGLATVYGIVKQSGGYVWAYSELGQGTTFKVYLPLAKQEPQVAKPAPAPPRASGETVLVVEDEATVRTMTSRALHEHGYRVVEASSGGEALELIRRHDGTLDLIVTDVVMPGLDGPGLAEQVARLRPALPILFMSGYTDDDIVRRGLLEAGQPFLQKPFTPEALIERVTDLLKLHLR
jgi:PAS domain S-box-containing protein